ncbi:MAG: Panacea domain-containing protein [Candidatus Altiarchaeota archaeon]
MDKLPASKKVEDDANDSENKYATVSLQVNNKLKEAIFYIVSKCNEKPSFGRVNLWKLLYFSDFNFYKKHYVSITGEEYRKLDLGPGPVHFDTTINALTSEGFIEEKKRGGAKYDPYVYTIKKDMKITHLAPQELRQIDNVIHKLGDCSATKISEISHKDTPWKVTDDKEIIDYDLVFYRHDAVAAQVE